MTQIAFSLPQFVQFVQFESTVLTVSMRKTIPPNIASLRHRLCQGTQKSQKMAKIRCKNACPNLLALSLQKRRISVKEKSGRPSTAMTYCGP